MNQRPAIPSAPSYCSHCGSPLAAPPLPRNPAGLTRLQRAALDFIKGEIARAGVSPSFEEIGASQSLASKAGVARLIRALHERGHIGSIPGKARSIYLLTPP